MKAEQAILEKIFVNPVELREIWEKRLTTEEHMAFFSRCVIQSIEAYRRGDYLTFDAHTTSKCCHGIALLTRILFLALSDLDLSTPHQMAQNLLDENRLHERALLETIDWRILVLMSMAVLSSIGELDPVLGRRTEYQRMKEFSPISRSVAKELGSDLQKYFSNMVAYSYGRYLDEMHEGANICGAPVQLWGRYALPEFFRTTNRKVVCAPCLYTTQVVLAYLIKSGAKVALINDLVDPQGQLKGRYMNLFRGDGVSLLEPVELREIDVEKASGEPVVVFSGCVFSDKVDFCSLKDNMIPWERRFPNLILACDVVYPQFPSVSIDPNFDSSSIEPEEESLREILNEHRKIPGVSAEDSSLFCLTHIFSASLAQVSKEMQGESTLPNSAKYIPLKALRNNPPLEFT